MKRLILLICGFLLLLLSGCMPYVRQMPEEETTLITVGFSQVGAESDWRVANTESMREALSEDNGFELLFDNARQKQENQFKAIRTFIQQDVDYIVLAPVTEFGWESVLEEARAANIPVIIVDRQVEVGDASLYTSWVGSDFRKTADEAVSWLAETLDTHGETAADVQILHLQGTPGSTAQLQRSAALEAGAARHGNWTISAQLNGDFTQAKAYVTGIKVIKQVNGESVDENYFGTPEYNSELSGCCHRVVEDDRTCIEEIKQLLSYLPQNFREKPPAVPCSVDNNAPIEALNSILPARLKAGYDVLDLISLIVDAGSIYEVQPDFARNVVCALTRLNGKTLGVVANQPLYLGGCIDINASDKMAHFITFCDAYNIPLLWLADCPGYLPGNDQESGGIIRHGAKVLYTFSSSTVPKVRIATRKYYGGSKAAFGDRAMGVDYAIAWPTCEESTMGGEGASQIIFSRELKAAKEQGEEAYQQKLAECAERFNAAMDSPYFWAKNLWTDMIIMPDETRRMLVHIYEALESKRASLPEKKHGIFPV